MESFEKLLEVATILLGPNGCPWDRKQTLQTLQPYLLEETHELIEAIDMEDAQKIKEELGDVLYTLIFIAKLAEREKLFALFESVEAVTEKLIRRHPHIFGDVQVEGVDDVMRNWEEIKAKEGRKSPFAGIPPSLPALARSQKIITTQRRSAHLKSPQTGIRSEEELVDQIWSLVQEAEFSGIDAESAMRRRCMKIEQKNTGE